MTESIPDETLVRDYLVTGDERTFATLVDRHKQNVHRAVAAVVGPALQNEAEDIAQMAFVRAHQRLRSFAGTSRFGTWLYRIAQNLAIDVGRRARYRRPHLPHASGDDADALVSAERAPDASAAASEERAQLAAMIARLSVPERSVIHLHYWMDLPLPDVARATAMPLGTVKSHLLRGRAKLARMMKETT